MDNPKNFKKFKKVPLLISVLVVALSVGALFAVYQGMLRNKSLAAAARQEWQAEEARRYEIQSLDIILRDIEEEITTIDSHFATAANIVPFLDSLEALAFAVGADPEVVAVDASKDGQELAVTVRAEGSFEAVYKFLELLENSPYELEFTAAELGKMTGESGAEWEAQFKVKLLSYIP